MGFVSIAALVGVVFLAWRVGQTMGRVDRLESQLRDALADHRKALQSLGAQLDSVRDDHRRAINIQAVRINNLDGQVADLKRNSGLHRDAQNHQARDLADLRGGIDSLNESVGAFLGIVAKSEVRLDSLCKRADTELDLIDGRLDALESKADQACRDDVANHHRIDALACRVRPLERKLQDAGNLFLKGS